MKIKFQDLHRWMTYLQPFNAWCTLGHTYLTNLQLKTTSLLKFVGPISEHQALKGCESQLDFDRRSERMYF